MTTIQENANNIVIAPTTTGAQIAGKVVWWELSGPVSKTEWDAQLRPVFGDGYESPTPRARKRLERALNAVAPREGLVRPAAKGGFVLVLEGEDAKGENEYINDLRVWTEKTPDGADQLRTDDYEHPLWAGVREGWEKSFDVLATPDVSVLLTGFAAECSAVPLRTTGGMYFIPASKLAVWEAMAQRVREVSSHSFIDLPCHNDSTAIESALKAIRLEAEEALEKIEKKLDSGAMNRRGYKGREKDLEDLGQKLLRYERDLGVTLDDLKAKTRGLKVEVATNLLEDMDL